MCIVSAIGDNFGNEWHRRYPGWVPDPKDSYNKPAAIVPQVTREEFLALKKEVELLRELLIQAVKYDKETGQPHCEQEEKIKLLKAIAAAFGVDLSAVFGPGPE